MSIFKPKPKKGTVKALVDDDEVRFDVSYSNFYAPRLTDDVSFWRGRT